MRPDAAGAEPQGSTIAVVGGANMDVVGQASGALLAGDSNPGGVMWSPGGVARNVAENLARLGQPVRLLSAVGDDEPGRQLLRETRAAGVNVDAVCIAPGQRTASYLSLHEADGRLALAVNDMRVLDELTPEVLGPRLEALPWCRAWVVECNLSEASLAAAMQIATKSQTGLAVFADVVSAAKCKRLQPWLGQIHTLKLNRLEAQVLTGQPVASLDDAHAATSFLRAAGVQHIVLSLGGDGVCWRGDNGAVGHRGVRPVAMVNTNGAGDALLAGLVDAWCRNKHLAEAVTWGMACAELTLMSRSANAANLNGRSVAERVRAGQVSSAATAVSAQ